MLGVCDLACAVLTYGAAFVLLPLLLGLPQVRKGKGPGRVSVTILCAYP
jgi:hypothetical protein